MTAVPRRGCHNQGQHKEELNRKAVQIYVPLEREARKGEELLEWKKKRQ